MTSESQRRGVWAALFAAAALGCGNYSNEDLEYMNAVPANTQLSASLPAYSAALPAGDEAELAKATHSVTTTFNGALANFSGIDQIRSYQPSGRTETSRTWGPFPSSDQPGWDWKLVVSRDDPAATQFAYLFQVENVDKPGVWLTFVSGTFEASGGVSQGSGMLAASTGALVAAGFPFDGTAQGGAGAPPFDTLNVQYTTIGYPITVAMTITRTPDVTNGVSSVVYTYRGESNGSGQMSFTLTGNIVPGPATEVVSVVSGWLPSGAGMATETIEQGDGAGSMQTECWDARFVATYNSKPWAPAEDVGTDPSACPALPTFTN